jgi:tRNA 2-selenouridine synthase
VWVEAESSRIGDVQVPADLWHRLKRSGGVELRLPAAERTRHLLREYAHFPSQPERLKDLLRRLRYRLGGATVDDWCADVDAGRWERFVANVLEQHYDPAYRLSFRQNYPHVTEAVDLTDTGPAAVRALAERLAGVSEAGADPSPQLPVAAVPVQFEVLPRSG